MSLCLFVCEVEAQWQLTSKWVSGLWLLYIIFVDRCFFSECFKIYPIPKGQPKQEQELRCTTDPELLYERIQTKANVSLAIDGGSGIAAVTHRVCCKLCLSSWD